MDLHEDLGLMTNEELQEYRRYLEKDISWYNNLQLAKKLCLNSAYGALG